MFVASSRLEPKEDNYKSHFPNIGDVSPDIPLNWFSIRGDLLSGWNKLWKKTYLFHNKAPILSEDEGWVVLKKGDWFSINFSHKSNKNYPDGHGHEDFGSFLLYFKGRQLLTDIGRFTYDDELETFSGKEESSHSVVLSNDLISKSRNSFFRRHGILEDQVIRDFRQCKQILNWETRNRKYFWNRTLEISEKKVNIADKINTESAKSFFYLSPDCQVKSINKNKIIVGLESVGNFEFEFIGIKNMSVKEVNFFPSYGIKKKTLRIGCEIPSENKPCKIETLIRKL